VLPHLVHVFESASLLVARASLPAGRYAERFNPLGMLDASLYPAALWPFPPLALLFPSTRRPALALLALGALAVGLTLLDLDPANLLRVQVPAGLCWALAAALGIAAAVELLSSMHARITLVAIIAASICITAIPCIRTIWRPTNEDEEERFLRAALAALPSRPVELVRLGYGDTVGAGGSPVHLYFPDYLARHRGAAVRDVAEWLRAPAPGESYFYLGVRCYTPETPFAPSSAPARVEMRPACRALLERPGAEPVLERSVDNRGDPLHTGFYGLDPHEHLRLALYRLR
jgi:hypothetical protein